MYKVREGICRGSAKYTDQAQKEKLVEYKLKFLNVKKLVLNIHEDKIEEAECEGDLEEQRPLGNSESPATNVEYLNYLILRVSFIAPR